MYWQKPGETSLHRGKGRKHLIRHPLPPLTNFLISDLVPLVPLQDLQGHQAVVAPRGLQPNELIELLSVGWSFILGFLKKLRHLLAPIPKSER